MTRLSSLFALLLFALTATVRAEQPPAATDVRELRDLPYIPNGHERQKLDLYLPAKPAAGAAPWPLIVMIHGGGWREGSKHDCNGRELAGLGFAAASIGYRLSQHAPYPAQIEDCKAAVRWLRAHAGEYGIDPARVGAWGPSAGGHLVALLGTTGHIRQFDVGENLDQSSAVQCVVDWFGPTDFLNWGSPGTLAHNNNPNNAVVQLFGGVDKATQEAARLASPVNFIDKDSAPFLLLHGDKDPIVPLQQSEEMRDALKKAGVECTLKVIPGAGHGSPAFFDAENRALMAVFVSRWLQPAAMDAPAKKP